MAEQILRNDILKEIFNISVGRAASMLSEITDKKILLSVPNVKISDMKNKAFKLDDYIPQIIDGTLMVSSISFGEKLSGKANLIFPAEKTRTLINLCIKSDDIPNNYSANFTDIDFDVIKEIGNIILNCIMGGLADHLSIKFNYALPEVKVFNRIDFSKDIVNNEYMHILILYITFVIDDTEIQGAVVIDLSLNSLMDLMEKLDEIGGKLYE